jgi:hypothetical protein
MNKQAVIIIAVLVGLYLFLHWIATTYKQQRQQAFLSSAGSKDPLNWPDGTKVATSGFRASSDQSKAVNSDFNQQYDQQNPFFAFIAGIF